MVDSGTLQRPIVWTCNILRWLLPAQGRTPSLPHHSLSITPSTRFLFQLLITSKSFSSFKRDIQRWLPDGEFQHEFEVVCRGSLIRRLLCVILVDPAAPAHGAVVLVDPMSEAWSRKSIIIQVSMGSWGRWKLGCDARVRPNNRCS